MSWGDLKFLNQEMGIGGFASQFSCFDFAEIKQHCMNYGGLEYSKEYFVFYIVLQSKPTGIDDVTLKVVNAICQFKSAA